jgi:4'-phosphopantetheinyl transferase EntD
MAHGFRPLLPDDIAVCERHGLLAADDEHWRALPEPERTVAAGIVARRRVEFAAGRLLARAAMTELGVEPAAIPRRTDRAPVWPAALVGAITHCDGLVAAAVARRTAWRAVGIDAEVTARVDAEILEHITTEAERERIIRGDATDALGAVLFAAKECVQKAFGPALEAVLPFAAVEAEEIASAPVGRVELLVRDARVRDAGAGDRLTVRWRMHGPLVLAALAVRAS